MKKLLAIITLLVFAIPAYATDENQKINNDGSFLGINFVKQPEEQGSKQLITNKKSFLCINIIVNGKAVTVKEPEAVEQK